jgi:hypothetical protein
MKRSQERLPFTYLVAWALLACVIPSSSFAGVKGDQVLYLGGTAKSLAAGVKGRLNFQDAKVGVFVSGINRLEIPYSQITKILYGQIAKQRIRRYHCVTLFFTGEDGNPQMAAFELGKKAARVQVHILEARTGKTVEFETEQAKKSFDLWLSGKNF